MVKARWRPDDPQGTFWRRAARVGVVVPIVLAATLAWGPRASVVYAVFGVICSLFLADFGGRPTRRAGAYAGLAAFGLVNIVVGSLASHSVWAGVACAFVVGVLARLVAVFGGYWGMGTFSALLAFLLAVTTELPPGGMVDRLGGWAVGCAVAAAAALTLWPRQERRDYEGLVAIAASSVALVLRSRLPGAGPVDTAELEHRTLAAIDSARQWLLTAPYRPAGPAAGDRALVELTMLLERASHAARQLPDLADDVVGAAALVEANATLLEAIARRLVGSQDSLLAAATEVSAQHDALRARVDAWVTAGMHGPSSGSAVQAERILGLAFRTLSCARLSGELALCAEVIVGGDVAGLAAVVDHTPDPGTWYGNAARILRSHLTLRSAWFRQCLRTGIGLAIAVGIALATGLDHGFWVVLGTLSVLRGSSRATTTTALRAVLGTGLGFVGAVVLIETTGGRNVALWILLPLVAAAAVYIAGVVDDIWGQAGFTVMVVMIFDLISPGGWQVGLVRVETVAIGAAVSIGVCALMWPRGAAQVVRTDVAAYFRSTGQQLTAVVRAFATGRDAVPAEFAQTTAADHQRAVQAYSEYLAESSDHVARWAVWARLLFVPSYAAFVARHVERMYVGGADSVHAPVASLLIEHSTTISAGLSDAGARIDPLARSSSDAAQDVTQNAEAATSVTPPEPHDLVSAELMTALRAADGSGSGAQLAVSQTWIDCWLRDLDEVVRDVDAPLDLLPPLVHRRWWSRDAVRDAQQPAR